MAGLLVVAICLFIVWLIRKINTVVSGDPKGSCVGEVSVAGAIGCACLVALLATVTAGLIAAAPIVVISTILVLGILAIKRLIRK